MFPSFNFYSTSLLLLVGQGYLFALLLLWRYRQQGRLADLLLALLLLLMGYHRSSYIIGFMGWYDSFPNTKINYYLIDLSLAMGPLLYFYVRSLTWPDFRWAGRLWWHFAPALAYALWRIVVWAHDAAQPGYALVQNGPWEEQLQWRYADPIASQFYVIWMVVYLVLSGQAYGQFRQRLRQHFSDSGRVELRWLRHFLLVFSALFLFKLALATIDSQIAELPWTQRWYGHLAESLAMLYVGTNAYIMNLRAFFDKTAETRIPVAEAASGAADTDASQAALRALAERLEAHMAAARPYLQPDLSLSQLAGQLGTYPSQLSQAVNTCFGKNFNDFVNAYRVEAVKAALAEGKGQQLSLLGIAYDCGFNSKATFNRAFRKCTAMSPSEFAAGARPPA